MKRYLTAGGLALGLALSGGIARAQTGIAQGKVLDASGKPLADVQVEISFQGGVTRKLQTKTNKKGEFIQVGLQPGVYRFTATREGYQGTFVEIKVGLGEPTVVPEIRLKEKGAAGGVPGSDVGQLFQKAVELTKAGKLDEAEAAYVDLIAKNPSIAGLHYNLGYVHAQKKEYDKAEAEYQKVIEMEPTNADAYIQLAHVYADEKKDDKASELIAKAVADHPSDAKLIFTEGVYFLNSQKTDEAVAAFSKAESLDPSNAETQFYLGILAVQQNKKEMAIPRLEKYLSMSPSNTQNVQTAQGLLQALKPKK